MILTEKVLIRINRKQFKYYKELGYNISQNATETEILVKDLSKGCHAKVDVCCDYCGQVRKMMYKDYLYNISKYNKCSCNKCAKYKREITCLEKYKTSCYTKTNEFKEKSQKTCLEKYNDITFKNPEKAKQTSLEKYGEEHFSKTTQFKKIVKDKSFTAYNVDNYMLSPEFRKKLQNGLIAKLGCTGALKNTEIIEKMKLKNLQKYGVDNYAKTQECQNRIKQTCNIRYGTDNVLRAKHEEIKQTNILKYGFEHPMQNSIIFEKQQNNAFRCGVFKGIFYRGTYELDFLMKYYKKIEIKKPKSISYSLNGHKRRYHPDFFIPIYNLIVEIKSSYTYNYNIEMNEAKRKATIDSGFNFIFIIDKKYEDFKKILKNNI